MQIDFGADAVAAQFRRHGVVIGHAVAVHHRHDDRPDLVRPREPLLAQRGELRGGSYETAVEYVLRVVLRLRDAD